MERNYLNIMKNPILYDVIYDLKGNEWCSWPKFAFHVNSSITDRNIDEGLRTLFDLFIDNPKKNIVLSII